jgi:tRNA-splicing ligase RtcB (3'-phosphate/5'-hydroxy nucleic acid ligase)
MPEHVSPHLLNWASTLEDQAREQAERTSRLPFIAGHVALMPDAHWGLGSTVGSVIPTKGAIIPAAVGVDIGCGMVAVETDLVADGLPDSLDKMLGYVEMVVPAGVGKGHERRPMAEDAARYAKVPAFPDTSDSWDDRLQRTAMDQFGSLGSGNHFVEICLDERDRVWVVLHSGSRGVGNKLAQAHINTAKGLMKRYFIDLEDPDLAYFVEGTPEFEAYITDMLWAQRYAMANREQMMDAVLIQLWGFVGVDVDHGVGNEVQRINCHHNYTEREHHHGKDVWVTRKGAIRARTSDLGVIPGSMGTSSYIVRGLGSAASYDSCSHGAGRRMSRGRARRELTVESLTEAMGDRTWNADKGEALLDEHPDSYKDIDQVMEDQKDLAVVEHTLHQILNYKGT